VRRTKIQVEAYCEALVTWARLALRPKDAGHLIILQEGCEAVRAKYSGEKEISALCAELSRWSSERQEAAQQAPWGSRQQAGAAALSQLGLMIRKSCLLNRLIYGGEALRTRPCPIHKGHFAGCKWDPCPAGCSFGAAITGWLPNAAQG
jgi:hypothetical protein